jgi:hypothetical protein
MTERRATLRSLAFVAVLALAAQLACNYPGAVPQGDVAQTAAVQTVAAQLTLVGPGQPTLPPAAATATPPPPATAVPTATFTPLPPPTATFTATPIPCNRAGFVTDVTAPDGTQFTSGATFTKTWRLTNTGSCTWTSGYSLVFDHGDQMEGAASSQLTPGTVSPGQTIDVSIPLRAPGPPGTYKGYWKIRSGDGIVFGVGGSGSVAFWVEIKSALPPPAMLDFTVSFENLHICSAPLRYATFRLGNTGTAAFQSVRIQIVDLNTSGTLYSGTNNTPYLATANDCPPQASSMGPGSVYFIAASIGADPPHGHNARLTLKMCTEDNLGGGCVEKTTDFVVP